MLRYDLQGRKDWNWSYRYAVLYHGFANKCTGRNNGVNQDKVFRIMTELARLGV